MLIRINNSVVLVSGTRYFLISLLLFVLVAVIILTNRNTRIDTISQDTRLPEKSVERLSTSHGQNAFKSDPGKQLRIPDCQHHHAALNRLTVSRGHLFYEGQNKYFRQDGRPMQSADSLEG